MEKDPIAQIADFSCGYVAGCPIVRGASLSFGGRRLCAIVGPNGAGKSTLLRGMAGLLPSVTGQMLLSGKPFADYSRRDISQCIALMASGAASPNISVRDYVMLGRTPFRSIVSLSDSRSDINIVRDSLAAVGMAFAADSLLSQLSEGQRQMTRLARAIAQQPRLLLLDEPTSSLDPNNAVRVLDTVRRLARERGIAVVAVLHDVNAARLWADDAVIMRDGRVLCSGMASEILNTANLSDAYGVKFELAQALLPSSSAL